MALTTNQLVVGMFNMAAGGYETEVDAFIAANGVDAAANVLLAKSNLNPQFLGTNLYDNDQFSANLIAQLLSGAGSALQALVAGIVSDYMEANASLSRGTVVVDVIEALLSVSESDSALGSYVTAFNAKVALADAYAGSSTDMATLAAVVGGTSATDVSLSLTVNATGNAFDNLSGGTGNDTFTARILNNSNTLESGDVLTGGTGLDTLFADIGTSQAFAITAETTGIETVQIRAQSRDADTPDNNMQSSEVQIDAQRMVGVTKWESNNSRADLIIEDVRIQDDQITKDITIAMVETDPGHVDYGVYFDPYSLRAGSSATSQLELELLDTRSQAAATGPLKDNPYWGFGFYLNGEAKIITSAAIDAALTYADLLTAIQGAITTAAATDSDLAGLTASLGNTFNRYDTESGALVQGTSIILTDSNGGVMAIDSNVGWQTQTGTVPPSSGIHTNIEPYDPVQVVDLITSKVILDDVGRGSTGGDLVIGSLSVGDGVLPAESSTSGSKGVERFEIEVRDNSRLQTINSTNNTLQEVTIVNGTTTSHTVTPKHTGVATVQNQGSLTVNGQVSATSTTNQDMEGADTQQNGGFGFSDVRLIDGSAMTGSLNFTAEVTNASIAKYLNLVDTSSSPTADNIAFQYSSGSGNDTMSVTIDGTVIGSTGTLGAREDFTFSIAGGSGNDSISLNIDDSGAPPVAWYVDQSSLNNVTVNGDAGNDTIRTPGWGDKIINAGTGNDTVYSDNGGTIGATWLVSAANLDTADLIGVVANNTNLFLYDGKVTVTLAGNVADAVGVTASGVAAAYSNGWESVASITTGSNYTVNQYYLNQAIKAAINSDDVLSKLLVAKDGPGNTLTITSLIDGAFHADDLLIKVSSTDINTLTGSTQTTVVDAYKAFAHNSLATAANAQTANAASVVDLNNNEGMDTNQVLVTTGVQSAAETDNTINMGSGTDVLTLSSGDYSNETVVFTGTEINTTIINFDDGSITANSQDLLDFSSYLTGKSSASGSTASQTPIAITLNADATVEANSVTVLSGLNFGTTDTFTGLTGTKLLAAINSTNTGSANYASITAASLNALNTYTSSGAPTSLVGGVGHAVVMVENDDNRGQYALFDLAFNGLAANATADFTSATLLGYADFGHQLTLGVSSLNGTANFGLGNGIQSVTVAGAAGLPAGGYNLSDTAGNLAAAGAVGNNAININATTGATVLQANTILAFTNSGVNSYAVSDTMAAADGLDFTTGFAGNTGVTLTAGGGAESVTGSANADVIDGGAGVDTIDGGAGNDSITGGAGADILTGGTGVDTFVMLVADVGDTINDFAVGSDVFDWNTALSSTDASTTVPTFQSAAAGTAIGATTTVFELTGVTGAAGAAGLVAALGGTATNLDTDANMLFVYYITGGGAEIYNWINVDADVEAGELTLVAELTGVAADAMVTANFI